MKNKFKFLLPLMLFFLALSPYNALDAQVDIDREKISEKCKDNPYEERVRVTVARFNVTTNVRKGRHEFGDELASMLTNTLQNVNCFRVLESLNNMSDMTDELKMGNSGYIDSESAPDIGKMLGAQAIFIGEVTGFFQSQGSSGALGLTLTNNKTKIEFIVKLINPETREVLWSNSYEAEGKTPGKYSGARILGLNLAGGNKKRNTLSESVERGMIKAVYDLTKEMDDIRFPEVEAVDETNTSLTTLAISNISFTQIETFSKLLQTDSKIKTIKNSDFDGKNAVLKVRHEGTSDEIMRLISTKAGHMCIISGFSAAKQQVKLQMN